MNSVGGDGISVVSDGVVPAEEEDGTDKDRPEDLDEDVRQDKDLPRVYFRWSFSDFVQTSLGDELRHDLLNQLTEHGEELDVSHISRRSGDETYQEDGKELIG